MVRGLIYYNDIEEHALARNIPVMQKEGIEFLIQILQDNNCKTCLEIGSAIGYSSSMMVSNVPGLQVETIELSKERYQEACDNFKLLKVDDRIIIHQGDALEFPIEELEIEQFDCLFIDAAKAQYQKFFEKYNPRLAPGGITIVDNLDFHGMIHDIEHIKNRNTKQLVKKIKRFKDWIFNHEQYTVDYYEIGDGICVIKSR